MGDQLVSIIVPVYNVEKYLSRCIESIIDQSYHCLQIILVDDGSKDKSGEICDHYAKKDSRITVIHQDNKGVSSARNAGINAMSGEYFTFVDSDDTLVSDAIETALQHIKEKEADVVLYGWQESDESGAMMKQFSEAEQTIEDKSLLLDSVLEHYSAFGGGYPWNKMWRMVSFSNLERFDENLYYFEDLEWVIRMLIKIKRMCICAESLYVHYNNSDSVSNQKEKEEFRELGYHHSINKVLDDIEKLPAVLQKFEKKYYIEVINGIIGARMKNYDRLCDYLITVMKTKRIRLSDFKGIEMKLRFLYACIIKTVRY